MQKAAKCMIGVHYPKPMVNHAEASRLNIERMKQIYQQLSCYRGLGEEAGKSSCEVLPVSAGKALIPGFALSSGLLATVPSNSNGNRNGNNETCFPVEASHDPSAPSGKQSETMSAPRAYAGEAAFLNRKHLALQVIRCPFTRRETGKAAS